MKENSSESIPKKEKKRISKRKVIIAVVLICTAIFGSFLIYFILQVALNTETPIVVVVSGSMKPNLNEGDLLFVKGINPIEIRSGTVEDKDGDIIVFDAHGVWVSPPDEPVVHRVVNKTYMGGHWLFQTKGDNDATNPYIDGSSPTNPYWVPDYKIYGIVCGRIPYIGWVKIILTDSGLLIPLLIIISVVLIVSIIRDVLKGDDEEERKKKKERKKKELKTEKVV
ncbi:MAG: signal peptidase I [Candidatus Hermodarchaeota archaeon]